MSKSISLLAAAVCILCGCATYNRGGMGSGEAKPLEKQFTDRRDSLPEDLADQVLALDPENVSATDVRNVLSHAPAPRIFNIHGGIYPVHREMISFCKFLVGMGYPEFSLTNMADGTYTFSCYESSRKLAGMIAWSYEKEGLRPIMIGHSQGGFQIVKILYELSGRTAKELEVWSPLTWEKEPRSTIIDPLTGKSRPVVGLCLPYCSAVGTGGLTRILPNQWDMCGRLRDIPDSVEDFTGFYKGKDLLGGDWLGYGSANLYHSLGSASVRNVHLPSSYKHGDIPGTEHLLASPEMLDWINAYRPKPGALEEAKLDRAFEGDSRHILWAADVWFYIKKHWVLELQRLILAKRALAAGPTGSGALNTLSPTGL